MQWLILLFMFLFVVLSAIAAFNHPGLGTRVLCAVLMLIFGLSLFGGIDYKTGESTVTEYNLIELSHNFTSNSTNYINTTTTGTLNETTTEQYTTYSGYVLNSIALIFVLLAVVLLFFKLDGEIYHDEEE